MKNMVPGGRTRTTNKIQSDGDGFSITKTDSYTSPVQEATGMWWEVSKLANG